MRQKGSFMLTTLVKKKKKKTCPPPDRAFLGILGQKDVTLPLGESHTVEQAFSQVEKSGHPTR